MRTLAVLAATAATALIAAGTASADVPNATVETHGLGNGLYRVCDTPYSYGVAFQYGAWGDYVDGCTVRLACPATNPRPCTVISDASIDIWDNGRGYKVTQNARLRIFASATATWPNSWRDRSCSSADEGYCESSDATTIAPGQSASTQCNGVVPHVAPAPRASNSCWITVRY
jgi:hypothetical protein